jgi:hypothetical protein
MDGSTNGRPGADPAQSSGPEIDLGPGESRPRSWEQPTNRHPKTTPLEKHERRKMLLQLLASGVDRREIVEVMRQKRGMTKGAVLALLGRVEDELREEDREVTPLIRAKQVRRLHTHIARAVSDKSWNAVASLERLLAQVRGTMEPVQVNVNIDATVREAVVHVLGAMPPDALSALIDGHEHALSTAEHGRSLVETTGEDAE